MKFEDLENIRQEYLKRFRKVLLICFLVVTILSLLLIIPMFRGGMIVFTLIFFAIFVSAIAYVFTVVFTRKDKSKFIDAYKTYFVENSLKNFFTDLNYLHNSGFLHAVLSNTGMMRTGDVYQSNDYISGKYNDVMFSQADIHIQDRYTDSDGNTHYVTIFKGRWMVFEFPKKFVSQMEIVQKGFRGNLIPRNSQNGKRIEKFETESITFNKIFNVYAEDGFEMFYILTPDIIQRIEDIASNGKRKILLCFTDNKLHVGLNDNKDAFEPPSARKSLDEKVELERVQADIKPITEFIDSLKLDKKMFKN
jgi:hypothetical protein